MAVSDFNSLIRVAKELKMLGFSIAIDDFGSGYSTIQLLYKLPIDVVKFDRNFLIKKENPIEDDIMNELVTICHKNGIIVVCEGIETTENEEYIKNHGCRYAQGFLYAKPIPQDSFAEIL